MCLCANI